MTISSLSGPAECNTSTHNSRPPNTTGPIKVVLDNCLVQQNVIQVHIAPVLQCHGTNRGRHLFVRVLHSAEPDNYLTVT
jgi:hypothetical protein